MGQANTDAREAEKQVSKGLEDLKVIKDELQNLPTLDDAALDRLGKCSTISFYNDIALLRSIFWHENLYLTVFFVLQRRV